VPAPFVFVEDWADLPKALEAFGAADPDTRAERLAAVATYRRQLETYLRDATLDAVLAARDPARPRTTCHTAPLAPATEAAQLDAMATYYTGDWYGAFEDSPAFPGSGCTTAYVTDGRKQHGAFCFDAACAPPDVGGFSCGPVSS